MSTSITIWHNKLCSTSKKALALLEENFEQVIIRDYISNPPSVSELETVLRQMNENATAILRTKDKIFKEKFEGKSLSDGEWLKEMSTHPSIIERPIIIAGQKAWLARPFEEVMPQIVWALKKQ